MPAVDTDYFYCYCCYCTNGYSPAVNGALRADYFQTKC